MRPAAIISLEPEDRGWLHARIGQRLDAMLDAGLVDEVRALRARGDLSAHLPSMRCVGYRQTWEALDAAGANGTPGQDAVSPSALASLRDRALFATRQLAKRQLTWLRGMTERTVVACDAPGAMEQVLHQVRRQLGPAS